MRLNDKIALRITSSEKLELQKVADELGYSLNQLCRAILNGIAEKIKYGGIKNLKLRLDETFLQDA